MVMMVDTRYGRWDKPYRAAGMDGYLSKPFQATQLVAQIRELVPDLPVGISQLGLKN